MTQRLWQAWPGKNRFCCDGRLWLPGRVCPALASVAIMIGTPVLFYLLEFPRLSQNGAAVTATVCALAALAVAAVAFLRTACRDPGVIPRRDMLCRIMASQDGRPQMRRLLSEYCGQFRRKPGEVEEAKRRAIERFEQIADSLSGIDDLTPAETFWNDFFSDSKLVHLRHCTTCQVKRPARSSHCRFCDNCVLEFDHHCFWVGNCIGARNHASFVMFLVSAGVSASVFALLAIIDMCLEFCKALKRGAFDREWWVLAPLLATGFVAVVALTFALLARLPVYRIQGLLTVAMLMMLLGWVYFHFVIQQLPWEPLAVLLPAGATAAVLAAAGSEQLSLVGRGLTVKQATRGPANGRGRRRWSLEHLLDFCTTRPPGTFAAVRARISHDLYNALDLSDEDAGSVEGDEEEEMEERLLCGGMFASTPSRGDDLQEEEEVEEGENSPG